MRGLGVLVMNTNTFFDEKDVRDSRTKIMYIWQKGILSESLTKEAMRLMSKGKIR
jgi:hypothetical protein